MERSKVYFTDMRALPGTNLPDKLKKLIRKAGIGEIDFEKENDGDQDPLWRTG